MITAVCISTKCSMFRFKINNDNFWCDCFKFQKSWMFKDKFITCIRIFLYNTGKVLKNGLALWSAISEKINRVCVQFVKCFLLRLLFCWLNARI